MNVKLAEILDNGPKWTCFYSDSGSIHKHSCNLVIRACQKIYLNVNFTQKLQVRDVISVLIPNEFEIFF